MIIRYPLTVLTLAAALMAGGFVFTNSGAFAGGMPSDEGPIVVPDEIGYDGSADNDTISAIINSLTPVQANYVLPVTETQTAAITLSEGSPAPRVELSALPSALSSPDDGSSRDHR